MLSMLHIVRTAAEERGFDVEPAVTKGDVRLFRDGKQVRTPDDRGAFRYAEALKYLRTFPVPALPAAKPAPPWPARSRRVSA